MKIKKFFIVSLLISLVSVFSLPSALFANDSTYDFSITVKKTATDFESGVFEYELAFIIFDPSNPPEDLFNIENWFGPGSIGTISYTGGNLTLDPVFIPIPDNLIVFGYIKESGQNGATGVEVSLDSPPTAVDGIINSGTFILFSNDDNTKTVYFDNIKIAHPGPEPKPEPETEPVWVRTIPMTCWQVWINEDNNFQFIFWYPYADKNWIRIYDLEGNLVYDGEILVDDPNLIVDLPDGMYTVKTYHDQELLQEFLIGKPGPEM